MPVNQAALHLLLSRAQYDLAATQSAALVVAGDRLGLYRALAAAPMTPGELAAGTGTDVRYLESWLLNQAAGGYATYDADSGKFGMTPEQTALLTDDTSPYFLPASFAFAASLAEGSDALVQAMRSLDGSAPGMPPSRAYDAIARMARSKSASIIDSLLSDDLRSMLENGADVVDVGCGSGALLAALAAEFPALRATGIDTRADAIAGAEPGGGVHLEQRDVMELPPDSYDLALCVETLHELPAPADAAAAIRRSLRRGGRLIVIEAPAGDDVTSNLNTAGRLLSATNVLFCLPMSGASGLGILAGEGAIRAVLHDAGFAPITRRGAEMHFVLECFR